WLGYPGATMTEIAQAETRLGMTLPPSHREFLMVTNGWRRTTPYIDKLWSTEEIDWFRVRNQDWIDAFTEGFLVYGDRHSGSGSEIKYLQMTLEISDVGDSAIYLLNPQVVTPEGEWEAWFFANWSAGATRYSSFVDMMRE